MVIYLTSIDKVRDKVLWPAARANSDEWTRWLCRFRGLCIRNRSGGPIYWDSHFNGGRLEKEQTYFILGYILWVEFMGNGQLSLSKNVVFLISTDRGQRLTPSKYFGAKHAH